MGVFKYAPKYKNYNWSQYSSKKKRWEAANNPTPTKPKPTTTTPSATHIANYHNMKNKEKYVKTINWPVEKQYLYQIVSEED